MKEERMFILKMLKDGDISSDEACKLIAALKSSETDITGKLTDCLHTVKDNVKKLAKKAEPSVKKCTSAAADVIDDVKANIKNRKPSQPNDEVIIVDETTEDAADANDEENKTE